MIERNLPTRQGTGGGGKLGIEMTVELDQPTSLSSGDVQQAGDPLLCVGGTRGDTGVAAVDFADELDPPSLMLAQGSLVIDEPGRVIMSVIVKADRSYTPVWLHDHDHDHRGRDGPASSERQEAGGGAGGPGFI